jgi:hypothetical protein
VGYAQPEADRVASQAIREAKRELRRGGVVVVLVKVSASVLPGRPFCHEWFPSSLSIEASAGCRS